MSKKTNTQEEKMSTKKTKKTPVLRSYDSTTGWIAKGITMEELTQTLKGLRKAFVEAGFVPGLVDDMLYSWFSAQRFIVLPEGK
jgi:hypothetical protein